MGVAPPGLSSRSPSIASEVALRSPSSQSPLLLLHSHAPTSSEPQARSAPCSRRRTRQLARGSATHVQHECACRSHRDARAQRRGNSKWRREVPRAWLELYIAPGRRGRGERTSLICRTLRLIYISALQDMRDLLEWTPRRLKPAASRTDNTQILLHLWSTLSELAGITRWGHSWEH